MKIPDCQDGLSFKLRGSCPPYVHAVKKGELRACVRVFEKPSQIYLDMSESCFVMFFFFLFVFDNFTSLAFHIRFNLSCSNETISNSVPNESSKDTSGFTEY